MAGGREADPGEHRVSHIEVAFQESGAFGGYIIYFVNGEQMTVSRGTDIDLVCRSLSIANKPPRGAA